MRLVLAIGVPLVLLLTASRLPPCQAQSSSGMPAPFTRVLQRGDSGRDVSMLQYMLRLATVDGAFGPDTQASLQAFQANVSLPTTGVLDVATANAVMLKLSPDNYVDDGRPAQERGYLYKIVVPVHRNRSIESIGTLYAANGTALFQFHARAHGYNTDGIPRPWPNWNSTNVGLTMYTDNGNTPTGLIECDLNTPESNSTEFGPYPINRAVKGLEGNAAFLIPNYRDGILLHTGEWPNWQPPQPMPNSEGCIHAWPQEINTIQTILQKQLGVVARPNTDGKLPYPYKCQGLLSVYQVD